MKEYVSIVIFSNIDNNELREAYEDDLVNLGYDEDEYPYESWKENECDFLWNDMMDNMTSSKWNTKCVVVGTLGLWDGTHTIIPCVCNDLKEAIRKCVGNADGIEITLENGFIKVMSCHHDGTNNFEIHILNKKGCNVVNGNLSNPTYYKKIFGYLY